MGGPGRPLGCNLSGLCQGNLVPEGKLRAASLAGAHRAPGPAGPSRCSGSQPCWWGFSAQDASRSGQAKSLRAEAGSPVQSPNGPVLGHWTFGPAPTVTGPGRQARGPPRPGPGLTHEGVLVCVFQVPDGHEVKLHGGQVLGVLAGSDGRLAGEGDLVVVLHRRILLVGRLQGALGEVVDLRGQRGGGGGG